MLRPLAVIAALLALCALTPNSGPRRLLNLPYATDGLYRHQLDLYMPPVRRDAPIVVFVHGGAFMSGDRRDYDVVGESLAAQGFATAVVSYRLYPQADAQGSTRDVAQAIAWVIAHASDYDLSPKNVFLVGHSAGGQIVALIGTHARYLAEFGVPLAALRGVVAVAGAYDVRDLSGEPDSWLKLDFHIYGDTEALRSAVSPALEIDAHSPPIQIVCGTADDPLACDRAQHFSRALSAAGIWAGTSRVIGGNHMGLLRAIIAPQDALNAQLHRFIEQNTAAQ